MFRSFSEATLLLHSGKDLAVAPPLLLPSSGAKLSFLIKTQECWVSSPGSFEPWDVSVRTSNRRYAAEIRNTKSEIRNANCRLEFRDSSFELPLRSNGGGCYPLPLNHLFKQAGPERPGLP